ncbi:MAG TPA: ABC transporter permease [Clostridia bacterium]|nr:ABC transporter permease [Clostridia bacterium]
MLKYIYRNFIYRKNRLIVMLLGVAILASGLSYLVGISHDSKITVQEELEKRWKSSYDILVLPKDKSFPLENLNIMESNQISNFSGGISIKDWEEIKKIEEVEVAAPVSIIGWKPIMLSFPSFDFKDPGIYRVILKTKTTDGLKNYSSSFVYYLMWPSSLETVKRLYPLLPDELDKFKEKYGINFPLKSVLKAYDISFPNVDFYKQVFLIGAIAPEEEAKLVGLDKSVIKGRYFSAGDVPEIKETQSGIREVKVPVLVMNWPFADIFFEQQIEKLRISKIDDTELLDILEEKGGKKYLDKIPAEKTVFDIKLNPEEIHEMLKKQLLEGTMGKELVATGNFYFLPTKVDYSQIESPYKDRWPIALDAKPEKIKINEKDEWINLYLSGVPSFRPLEKVEGKVVYLKPIGFYDVQKLKISKDPLSEQPMEQYRPAQAQVVLDENKVPKNPVVTLKPTGSPLEIITSPPTILTTIKSAEAIRGDKPISAIRVKIKGAEHLSSEAQKKAEEIASKITSLTGHKAYVTLGSSPRNILVHAKGIGYLQELWIQLGAAMTIVRETTVAFWVFILVLVIEAVLFMLATSIVSILSRMEEFAILSAVGWRNSHIRGLIVKEGVFIGTIVGIIASILTIIGGDILNKPVEISRLLSIFFISLFAYVSGTGLSAFIQKEENLTSILKSGEVQKQRVSRYSQNPIFNLILSNVFNRPWRALLSISSASVPVFLLSILFYIKVHLNSMLNLTLLGEYISLKIEPQHYLIGIVSAILAFVTISDLISLNILDRKFELSLLLALGWRKSWVRNLVIAEGAIYGFIAGVLGLIGANGLLLLTYKGANLDVKLAFLVIIISTVIGGLSALVPFEIKIKQRRIILK